MLNEKKKERLGAPNGFWFHMPREITLSSELDPYQYRMLALLMDRENRFQSSWFWCATGWLVAHSGMKRTKAKETLRELEEKGFISITSNKDTRKPNRYHIKWDFINSYQRPMTQEELEGLDDQEEQYEPQVKTAPVVATASTPKEISPQRDWKQYLTPPEKTLNNPYYLRRRPPEDLKEMGMPFTLPKNNKYPPAKEWYCASNRQYVRDTYFPTLLEKEQSHADTYDIMHYVYAGLLCWVMPCVEEYKDAMYVWEEVIKPDYEEYKQEQLAKKQADALL